MRSSGNVVVLILHCNARCWYSWRIYNSCFLLIPQRESQVVYIYCFPVTFSSAFLTYCLWIVSVIP